MGGKGVERPGGKVVGDASGVNHVAQVGTGPVGLAWRGQDLEAFAGGRPADDDQTLLLGFID